MSWCSASTFPDGRFASVRSNLCPGRVDDWHSLGHLCITFEKVSFRISQNSRIYFNLIKKIDYNGFFSVWLYENIAIVESPCTQECSGYNAYTIIWHNTAEWQCIHEKRRKKNFGNYLGNFYSTLIICNVPIDSALRGSPDIRRPGRFEL